ncbi:MAG: mechanosensitive ion channel family protein [Acidimicrobiales bacterium]
MRFQLTTSERLDACGEDPSSICNWVADRTDSVGLARAADLLLDRPLRILLIIIAAALISRVVRWLINRFASRLAQRSAERFAQLERRTPRLANGSRSSGDAEEISAASRLHLRIDTMVAVLSSLSTVVVWSVAAVVVLAQFNISLAPLFAGAGVLGVALGFGAQSVVADFLSGFFMLFEDQFGVGDVVDLGEASGTVENLSLRTTTIRDVNGTVWHIRNSEIRRVGNKSQLWSRAVLDIDVAYDTDIRRAEGIIQRVADELWRDPNFTDADIIDPPQVWGVENLGADGVSIRLVVKTDPAEQWIVARELRLRIKEALDEAGIEIPFPQRTIWLRHDEVVAREDRPQVAVAPLRIPEPTEEMVENPD